VRARSAPAHWCGGGWDGCKEEEREEGRERKREGKGEGKGEEERFRPRSLPQANFEAVL
jgi:hypothetical protein